MVAVPGGRKKKLDSNSICTLVVMVVRSRNLDSSSDESDAENVNTRSDLNDKTTSEAPSLPSHVEIIFENLSETDTATEGEYEPCTSQTLMKETFSGNILETSQSIFTPIKTRFTKIYETMAPKRYQQIRRYVHFANNNINDDKYYRIRPVLDILRRKCYRIEEGRKQSVDEMMVSYKGKKRVPEDNT
ncbi:hypothetical protein JTB14_035455 [Gonioctena quinquepunctata]|nr:hypothetical protein JTB14_035455 [Gonioctena quinquepunctata]